MVFILLLTGLFVGIVSSFFGIGGGTIIMPILYGEFPQIPANVAIANSLAVIALTSLTNLYFFNKNGLLINKKMALTLVIGMGLSTIFGVQLAAIISDKNLRLLLAWVLLFSSINTLLKKSKSYTTGDFQTVAGPKILAILALASIFAGLLAGLTGLGGGIILIPLFVSLLNMPLRYVPLYTNVGMFAGSLVTFLFNLFKTAPIALHFGEHHEKFLHFQFGLNNLALMTLLFLGSFLGSRIGVKGLGLVTNRQAKYLFFTVQILFSLRLFIKNW